MYSGSETTVIHSNSEATVNQPGAVQLAKEKTHAMFIVVDKTMPETMLIDHEVLDVMLWSFFALMVNAPKTEKYIEIPYKIMIP